MKMDKYYKFGLCFQRVSLPAHIASIIQGHSPKSEIVELAGIWRLTWERKRCLLWSHCPEEGRAIWFLGEIPVESRTLVWYIKEISFFFFPSQSRKPPPPPHPWQGPSHQSTQFLRRGGEENKLVKEGEIRKAAEAYNSLGFRDERGLEDDLTQPLT